MVAAFLVCVVVGWFRLLWIEPRPYVGVAVGWAFCGLCLRGEEVRRALFVALAVRSAKKGKTPLPPVHAAAAVEFALALLFFLVCPGGRRRQ